MSTPYPGVILAAGRGSRMGALADHVPKALLPVCNEPLIHRHLGDLAALGVRDVLIVVGHLGDTIKRAVGDGTAWGISINYVTQVERRGLAHALGQLESHIDRPFYLILGDIYFEFDALDALHTAFADHDAVAALAVREETDLAAMQRNFSVEANPSGRVTRVVEKPAHPRTTWKGCGCYLFDPCLFQAIRKTPRSSLRNEYELTDAIQVLIDDGATVQGVPMVAWDVNITEPADLIACNVHALTRRRQSCCTGKNCRIAPGTDLLQTSVGDGAQILHPIRLERCVVLPGAVVDAPHDLSNTVVAPGQAPLSW